MKHERLIKSRSKKLGAILTVSSLIMVNFLSPVAALAQGSPDIQMAEEGDFVHDSEDIVLPDLSKLDELKTLEVERGHFDVSDIEVPNPPHQMEVEVGTFVELQRAIYSAQPDTALVINITRNIEFDDVIVIEGGLDITIQSDTDTDRRLSQESRIRYQRHFIVQTNSLLTMRDGILLIGDFSGGGIGVHHATFNMEGGRFRYCVADFGGAVYVDNGIVNMTGGRIWHNASDISGGGLYVKNGEFNMYGGGIGGYTQGDGGGLYISNGEFNMYGGDIEGVAEFDGGGGGVYALNGEFNMYGGRISGSAEAGGGIYLNGGTANLTGGSLMNGSAEFGGGMFINEGIANLNGGEISSNIATTAGGGIYIDRGGNLEMENGSITYNEALQGGGVVVGDLATFTMRGGIIDHNTAPRHCAISVNPSGTFNHEGGVLAGYCIPVVDIS